MPKKYNNLFGLMDQDEQAKKYYNSLPDYVKDQIATRADNVNTFSGLRDYAQNLMRGED